MITRIGPRDLDRGERIVALVPISGRAVIVSLLAPLIPLSAGAFILLHRNDLYDFGFRHFFASHEAVTTFIASTTGVGRISDLIASKTGYTIDLAGIVAYALAALVLLGILAFLGRWALASVLSSTVELFVRPVRLIPFFLFTARAVTTKGIIVKSGVFRAAPVKMTLERIKTREPRFHGRIGELLDYGSISIGTDDGARFPLGWVTNPREVCDAFNLAFGSDTFTAAPDPDLMVIDGQARILDRPSPRLAVATRPTQLSAPGRAGDLESKTDLLVRMLIADPDHPVAWSMLAEAYAALGRHDQAAKARRVHQALNGAKAMA